MVYYGRDFRAYRQTWDGSGDEERLEVGVAVRDANISGDGKYVVFSLEEDLWASSLSDGSPSIQLTRTEFQERHGRVSPDGRWLAYSSNESGTWEIYMQPFPGPGAKHLVSTDGGTQPQWRTDGEEFFLQSDPSEVDTDGDGLTDGRAFDRRERAKGFSAEDRARASVFLRVSRLVRSRLHIVVHLPRDRRGSALRTGLRSRGPLRRARLRGDDV